MRAAVWSEAIASSSFTRQPKDRMIRKLGQQLRINRSKIKETSDTNTDFDDLDGAIRSGYLLKDGLSNNEDFYYLNLLVTITAANVEDLEFDLTAVDAQLLAQLPNHPVFRLAGEEHIQINAVPGVDQQTEPARMRIFTTSIYW